MRRFIIVAVAATLGFTCLRHPVRAELCTIDAVPAATLLLPYFEVNLNRFPRVNKAEQTIISIHNATRAPTIAQVTLWTDLSVETLTFSVYLTGYDVEEVNLTELFYTGGIRGLATDDQGSRGFVLGESPAGGLQTLGELIRAHRGESVNGSCYGRVGRGNIARGYVTIDNVDQFSTLFPNDAGYFGPGAVASNDNELWGTVRVVFKNSIQTDLLVHIEAGDFEAGDYTFYGRYVSFNGSDKREPLGTTWGVRYDSGKNRTDLVVWRDSTVEQQPFPCSQLGQSGWYPLGHLQVVAFDQDEDAVEPFFDPDLGEEIAGLPAETQKIKVVSGEFDTAPFRAGWIYLNLGIPPGYTAQSYLWVRHGFKKRAGLSPGLPWYDADSGAQPSDASACGPAPSTNLLPIR